MSTRDPWRSRRALENWRQSKTQEQDPFMRRLNTAYAALQREEVSPSVGLGEAAKLLGVIPLTLKRWAKSGRFKPDFFTGGGKRRYRLDRIIRIQGSRMIPNDPQ